VVVAKLSGVQTLLPITLRQASKSRKKIKKLHRNLVVNLQLDEASVTVTNYTMSVGVAIAILLTYSCSAPIMLPWVQQWRSNTFSPALECQSLLPQKWENFIYWVLAHTTLHYFYFSQPPLPQPLEEARLP
jgi:hypothetical protein